MPRLRLHCPLCLSYLPQAELDSLSHQLSCNSQSSLLLGFVPRLVQLPAERLLVRVRAVQWCRARLPVLPLCRFPRIPALPARRSSLIAYSRGRRTVLIPNPLCYLCAKSPLVYLPLRPSQRRKSRSHTYPSFPQAQANRYHAPVFLPSSSRFSG